MNGRVYDGMLTDSSDFGLLGEQSLQKWEIPLDGRGLTTEKNWTTLALSSAEKSVTVQIHKKRTNSNRYIHTLPIGIVCITTCNVLSGIINILTVSTLYLMHAEQYPD